MRRWLLLLALFVLIAVACTPPPTTGLRTGNLAPALEGPDVTGTALSLANYRGKVVVVDFWATWCKYCVVMIPDEKKLVKKMEGRPFVLLGVSADANRADLTRFLDANDMHWPMIHDGKNGPNAAVWQIDQFPTIYVIDAKGMIRYRDIDGPDLDRAVDKLVAEAEKNP